MLDSSNSYVHIQFSSSPERVWVNIDDICAVRITDPKSIQIDDNRRVKTHIPGLPAKLMPFKDLRSGSFFRVQDSIFEKRSGFTAREIGFVSDNNSFRFDPKDEDRFDEEAKVQPYDLLATPTGPNFDQLEYFKRRSDNVEDKDDILYTAFLLASELAKGADLVQVVAAARYWYDATRLQWPLT